MIFETAKKNSNKKLKLGIENENCNKETKLGLNIGTMNWN